MGRQTEKSGEKDVVGKPPSGSNEGDAPKSTQDLYDELDPEMKQEVDCAMENMYGGILHQREELGAGLSASELERQRSQFIKDPSFKSEYANRLALKRMQSLMKAGKHPLEGHERHGGHFFQDEGKYDEQDKKSLERYETAPTPQDGDKLKQLRISNSHFSDDRSLHRRYTSSHAASIIDDAISEAEEGTTVMWDENDPENPRNWKLSYRWFICAICTATSLLSVLSSSAPSIAAGAISKDLHMSTEVSKFILTLFLLGYVIGPFVWAPLSEILGRRLSLVIPAILFLAFQIECALAHNIPTLLMGRFFSGAFGAAAVTNVPAVFADVHDAVGRGLAMNIFGLTMFLGPSIGPMIAAFITKSHLGWRWIFWVILIVYGALLIVMVFALPETYAPIILKRKAQRLRKEDPEKNADLRAPIERSKLNLKEFFFNVLCRPFTMLFVEPILLLITLFVSIVYALLYAMMSVIPIIYLEVHHWPLTHVGLIYLSVSAGTSVGCVYHMYMMRDMHVQTEIWHGTPPPELRLRSMYMAGPLLCAGLFMMGWTGNYAAVPWYVPMIAIFLVCIAFSVVFMASLTYIVDVYLMYAASAMAANTAMRSAVAAAFPLFITQMYHNLGINWASTLWALVALLLTPIPFFFTMFAEQIRGKSKYAPCIDLKIKDQVMKEVAMKTGDVEAGADNEDAKHDSQDHEHLSNDSSSPVSSDKETSSNGHK